LLNHGQVAALHFQRNDPARGAQPSHPTQRRQVVDIEVWPGHKRHFAGQALHGTHVVGFHQEVAVAGDLVHGADFGAGLQQHLSGQHHLLAGILEHLGHVQPVGQAQFMAARADGFAQVDDVHRRVADGFVEI
jgi:hypothetical protein